MEIYIENFTTIGTSELRWDISGLFLDDRDIGWDVGAPQSGQPWNCHCLGTFFWEHFWYIFHFLQEFNSNGQKLSLVLRPIYNLKNVEF